MVIKQLRPALTAFILLTILLGILYPLTITAIAQGVFPAQANGSLISKNGGVVGSELIGQNFTSSKYFWGRPSATSGSPYSAFDPTNLTGSSGSNLGPLSKTLIDSVQQRVSVLKAANPDAEAQIPVDLVTASGSGLDPDISLASAYYQVPRVAQARGTSESDIIEIINNNIENESLAFLGLSYVNILKLNIILDDLQ